MSAIWKRLSSPTQFLLLTIAALVPRVLGAIWLPNAFGDAYCYTEQIYYMRRALLAGDFGIANLFGFWLPLYQLICALISTFAATPFYVAKLVSAAAGAGVCVLVFALLLELTADKRLALIGFVVIALNPEHILYSASAMTDVPHAFLVLLCVYCCIRSRWVMASCLALLAGLMRIEGWLLILLVPLAQLLREHKLSAPACLILPLGPLLWFYISWQAGGSPWSYFAIRNEYIRQSLAAAPTLAHLTLRRLGLDLARLLYGANPIILLAGLGVVVAVKRRMLKSFSRWVISGATILAAFFGTHLVFLLAAYFSGNQPDIWPRYGLILLALGLPLAGRAIVQARADKPIWQRPNQDHCISKRKLRLLFQLSVILLCLHFCGQVFEMARLKMRTDPNLIAAQFLREKYAADKSLRVYCENGAVRVLSGIPLEQFVDQYSSPHEKQAFLESLREKRVRYLVYTPDSQLSATVRKIEAGRDSIVLQSVLPKPSEGMELYRVDDLEIMAKQKPGSKRQHATRY